MGIDGEWLGRPVQSQTHSGYPFGAFLWQGGQAGDQSHTLPDQPAYDQAHVGKSCADIAADRAGVAAVQAGQQACGDIVMQTARDTVTFFPNAAIVSVAILIYCGAKRGEFLSNPQVVAAEQAAPAAARQKPPAGS